MSDSNQFDAIVIGSGIGGLTTALSTEFPGYQNGSPSPGSVPKLRSKTSISRGQTRLATKSWEPRWGVFEQQDYSTDYSAFSKSSPPL